MKAEYKLDINETAVDSFKKVFGHCVVGYIDGDVPKTAPRKANRVFWAE